MRRILTSASTRLRSSYLPDTQKRYKSDEIPPLLLYTTASPHVYVSSEAIHQSPSGVNPKSLFTELKPPPSFQSSSFKYISPSEFNFELPSLEGGIPEVCFLGRSNVGKSSLLNALTIKDLAKTSKTPGRTQQVNYFGLYPHDLNGEPLGYFIDLPGYGYAQAPDEVVAEWQTNTQDFLQDRIEKGNLTRVYILVDARRGMKVFDSSILGWLDEAECDYTVVLTKADSVGKAKLVKVANEICWRHHAQILGDLDGGQGPCVHVTSSKKNHGIVDLMWAISADFSVGAEELKDLNHSGGGADSNWGKSS